MTYRIPTTIVLRVPEQPVLFDYKSRLIMLKMVDRNAWVVYSN